MREYMITLKMTVGLQLTFCGAYRKYFYVVKRLLFRSCSNWLSFTVYRKNENATAKSSQAYDIQRDYTD